jgi:hypothetical protein
VAAEIELLMGKTLTRIEVNTLDAVMMFYAESGEVYKMHHQQDCCESVQIEDITGDLDDLIGSPILIAEERSSPHASVVDAVAARLGEKRGPADSETWTFYEIGTFKGRVTIRWYGASNGYYSESVSFELMENPDE